MLKILELFGGIGSPRKALENMGVNIKSIDYVEILPHAVHAYNSIFDNGYTPQDVRTWNRNVDLLAHGSPCQDWSKNGLNNIQTGRSILYERTLEIIEHELNPKPPVVIWENVPGLLSTKHIEHFNFYLQTMDRLGYHNSFKILNSKDYGTPQNRERIFVISTLERREFRFPKERELDRTLADFIDFSVDPYEYELTEAEKSLFFQKEGQLYIRENNKRGYKAVYEFDSINVERPNSTTRRGRVGNKIVQCLTTSPNIAVYYDNILRKLTPKEYWLLMGFSAEDFERVAAKDLPKAALYKLPGNSIVVSVMEALYQELIDQEFIAV